MCCHYNNASVLEVFNRGYSRDRKLMHLLRCLFFISEKFRVNVDAVHCPRKYNIRTDVLSHNDIPHSFLQAPQTVNSNGDPRALANPSSRETAGLDIPALESCL